MGVPSVDVIICHHNGREILGRCLASLQGSTFLPTRVIVVDNASTDGSREMLRSDFPDVEILGNGVNIGYAKANNLAWPHATGTYLFFLNNDTELDPCCIGRLVEAMEEAPDLAICQPKIKSMERPDYFDYAGGAGGFLDVFGIPFTRGRIVDAIEHDEGQYDDPMEIFWASGAAMLVRRSMIEETGLFDEDFVFHMEEIDLAWRMHLRGGRIACIPSALVFHMGGYAPGRMDVRASYFKHRNSLAMMLKNYGMWSLASYLPRRLAEELVILAVTLSRRDWEYAGAIVHSWWWLLRSTPALVRKRHQVQRMRLVPEEEVIGHFCPTSVLLRYYLGSKRFSDLRNGDGWAP